MLKSTFQVNVCCFYWKNFLFKIGGYKIVSEKSIVQLRLRKRCSQFRVPNSVLYEKKDYKVRINIYPDFYHPLKGILRGCFLAVVTFNSTSNIENVPLTFIYYCYKSIKLPKNIK